MGFDVFALVPELGIEALSVKLEELSLGTTFTRGASSFANLELNGSRALIKLRRVPVTVRPHNDQFNNLKMDVKLPNDQQGNVIVKLDQIWENLQAYPHINARLEGFENLSPRTVIYGEFCLRAY